MARYNNFIARDELLYHFAEIMPEMGENEVADEMYEIALEARSIDVDYVRHGRWVIVDADDCDGTHPAYIEYDCSECGYEASKETGEYDWCYGEMPPEKYCPNCGAKMDLEEEHNG